MTTATAQAAAHRSPGRVHDLRAVSHSSASVDLSWTRPTSTSFHTTVVRYAAGTRAPLTAYAGRSAARFGHLRHTLTVGRLHGGRSYAFSVFALDASGRAGHRVSTVAVVAPAAVTHVRSYAAASPTTTHLSWTDPTTRTLRRVVVRLAKGAAAPASPTRGRAVRVAKARGTSATVTGLARNTTYSVSVWALDRRGGYSSPGIARFTTTAGADPNGTVTGLVTDTAGHPLSGVRIDAYGLANGSDLAGVTGTDGRYTVSAPAGDYDLLLGGVDITGGASDATGYVGDIDEAVVRAGHTTIRPAFRLEPGAAVSGRLVDDSGRPVAGAKPYAAAVERYVDPDSDGGIYSSFYDLSGAPSSAADGTYVLRGLPTDGAVRICAAPTDSGHSMACAAHTLVLAAGQSATVANLVLPAEHGGSVMGTVRGLGGVPLANAFVHLDGAAADQSDVYLYAPTDSAGRYRINAVPPGTYRACAESATVTSAHRSGFAPGCSARGVAVRSGALVGLDVTLPVGAAVTGTVTGPSGRPVAHADVSTQNGDVNGSTDSHGQYTLTGLAAGGVRICASTPRATEAGVPTGVLPGCWHGHAKAVLSAGRIRNGINLRLARAGALSGTVTGADGRPVPYASVNADNDSDDEDAENFGYAQADADGRFTIRGLATDSYDVCADVLTASGTDSETCRPGETVVRVGRTTAHVDVRLPASSAIRVSVRDAAGLPVAGADAVALSSCSDECDTASLFSRKIGVSVDASQTSDSAGTALLDGLDPGAHAVCLYAFDATTSAGGSPTGYADRCSGTTFSVRVTRGSTTALTLMLPTGGAVSGRVIDTGGHPVAGARALVSQSAATDYDSDDDFPDDFPDGGVSSPGSFDASAADGTYTAIGVQPGARTVCVDARSATGSSRPGYLDRCRGAAPGSTAGGTKIVVTAGAVTSHVDVTLTPAAGISGTVRRGSKAVADASVIVFAGRDDDDYIGSAGTSSDGRYTVTNLTPGRVTVCVVSSKASQNPVGRCWKNVAWDVANDAPPLARATTIRTVGGVVTTGIDVRLSR